MASLQGKSGGPGLREEPGCTRLAAMYHEEEDDRPDWEEVEPEEEKEGSHLRRVGPIATVLMIALVIGAILLAVAGFLDAIGNAMGN